MWILSDCVNVVSYTQFQSKYIMSYDKNGALQLFGEYDYQDITHSFDIWYVAINLAKRLAAAASKVWCKDLLPCMDWRYC